MASIASKHASSRNYTAGLICAVAGFSLLWTVASPGQTASYLVFLGAIAVASTISGFRSGLLVLVVGFLSAQWSFPEKHFTFHLNSLSNLLMAASYLGLGLAIAWFL